MDTDLESNSIKLNDKANDKKSFKQFDGLTILRYLTC